MQSRPGRAIVQILAIAFALLGLVLSHHLLTMHVELSRPQASFFDQFCGAFKSSSCDEVLKSPYSVFRIGIPGLGKIGIPFAQLGSLFFMIALCWLVVVNRVTSDRTYLHVIVCVITFLGVGLCGFLAYKMYHDLPKWCPLCATTHIATLIIAISLLLLWPRPAPQVRADALAGPPATPRSWPQWQAVGVIVLLITLGMMAQGFYVVALRWQNKAGTAEGWQNAYKQAEKLFNRYNSRWQHTLLAWELAPYAAIKTEDVAARGPADAAHTIVVFSDFQCPSCAKLEEALRTKVMPLAEKTGGARIIFKHWPISGQCNPNVRGERHAKACIAAKATEAARIVGGADAFWKMHDLLFAQQAALKTADEQWFVDRAVEIGLAAEEFRQALQSPAAADRVTADIQEGINLGKDTLKGDKLDAVKVSSTPSLFVDGRPLMGWQHMSTWRVILSRPAPPAPVSRPATGGSQEESPAEESVGAADSAGAVGPQP